MPITALFAGLLAPLYILLMLRVISLRRSARVSLGDGGDKDLARRMRVHANFADNVPYTLALMGLAESLRASPTSLYAAGACLLAGRLTHAYGVSQSDETLSIRTIAMILTVSAVAIAALACVRLTIWGRP